MEMLSRGTGPPSKEHDPNRRDKNCRDEDATTNALLSSIQYMAFAAEGNFVGTSMMPPATP